MENSWWLERTMMTVPSAMTTDDDHVTFHTTTALHSQPQPSALGTQYHCQDATPHLMRAMFGLQHASDMGDPQHASDMGDPEHALDMGDPQHASDTGDPQYASDMGDPQYASDMGDPQYASDMSNQLRTSDLCDIPLYASDLNDQLHTSDMDDPLLTSDIYDPQLPSLFDPGQYLTKEDSGQIVVINGAETFTAMAMDGSQQMMDIGSCGQRVSCDDPHQFRAMGGPQEPAVLDPLQQFSGHEETGIVHVCGARAISLPSVVPPASPSSLLPPPSSLHSPSSQLPASSFLPSPPSSLPPPPSFLHTPPPCSQLLPSLLTPSPSSQPPASSFLTPPTSSLPPPQSHHEAMSNSVNQTYYASNAHNPPCLHAPSCSGLPNPPAAVTVPVSPTLAGDDLLTSQWSPLEPVTLTTTGRHQDPVTSAGVSRCRWPSGEVPSGAGVASLTPWDCSLYPTDHPRPLSSLNCGLEETSAPQAAPRPLSTPSSLPDLDTWHCSLDPCGLGDGVGLGGQPQDGEAHTCVNKERLIQDIVGNITDEELVACTRKAVETNDQSLLTKIVLKRKLQLDLNSKGKAVPDISDFPVHRVKHELRPEEKEKEARRRQAGRVNAKTYRDKVKRQKQDQQQVMRELQEKNSRLRHQVSSLEDEIKRLRHNDVTHRLPTTATTTPTATTTRRVMPVPRTPSPL